MIDLIWRSIVCDFFSMNFGDILFLVPDIYYVFSILVLLIFGIFFEKKIHALNISRMLIELTLPIIFFSFFFVYFMKDINLISFFTIKIDLFYVLFRFIFLFFLLFCIVTARNVFFFDKIYIFEFSILLLLSAEGSFLMVMTDNLFTFYLALEMQNLCFYVLASLKRYNNFSTEAGLKYFLLGTFSSSILLFGISLLYGILGTLDLKEIYILLNYNNFDNYSLLLFISLFFLLSGLLFKIGSAPFHYWVPDVYEGAPSIVTMFFSLMPKIVLVFIFVKYYFFIFCFDYSFFGVLFFICGILSLFVGVFNAMFQLKIKRFFAYSAIANVGFILISFSTMSFDGVFSGLFFLFCYLFSVALFFFFLLNFRKINNKEFFFLFDLSLINNNQLLLFIVCIIFLSFAGIPPLIGFFSKFFFFFSLLNNFNYLILFIVLLFSVISSFYYIRVIRFIYFTKITEFVFIYNNNSYLFVFIFLFNLLFFFFFDFFCEIFYFILIKSFFYL